jgi:hypothetical protein
MIPLSMADEYPVRLSTGEVIAISEIDAERSPALAHPEVRKLLSGLLQHCCHVSRDIMEEAKAGYDTQFKALLRAVPMGCMLKAEPHRCRLINECSMASQMVCTLHNCARGPSSLPICWEYDSPASADAEVLEAAISLGTIIGHAWRQGRYVCIVDN